MEDNASLKPWRVFRRRGDANSGGVRLLPELRTAREYLLDVNSENGYYFLGITGRLFRRERLPAPLGGREDSESSRAEEKLVGED